jgi:hypothetical protein
MHPAVKINESIFQTGFILLSSHTIASRRGLTLESLKAVAEEADVETVKQSCEPFLLPFPCSFTHTVQSLGHALPPLCQMHVRLNDVLLRLYPPSPAPAKACPAADILVETLKPSQEE